MHGLDEANLGEDDPLKPFAQHPQLRRRLILFSVLVGAVLLLLVVQGFNAESPTRRLLGSLIADVQDPRWGALYVLVAFAAGTLVFAPITAMFVATSLVLTPFYGFVYCLLGGLWGARSPTR